MAGVLGSTAGGPLAPRDRRQSRHQPTVGRHLLHTHSSPRYIFLHVLRPPIHLHGSPLTRDAGGSRLVAFSERHFEGKKIGVNLLRTIILTYTHGDALNEMEHDANTHGHSIATQRVHYIKKLEVKLGKRKREK